MWVARFNNDTFCGLLRNVNNLKFNASRLTLITTSGCYSKSSSLKPVNSSNEQFLFSSSTYNHS